MTTWTANAAVTTTDPSGIGFVNFGAIDQLDVRAPQHDSIEAWVIRCMSSEKGRHITALYSFA